VLALLFAAAFAFSGVTRDLPIVSFLIQAPFDLDWALRTVSLGWYEPARALPVTVVDIDEATYRGWQSPAITKRGELARLIEVVTRASPGAVVVDIDLSGRTGDAAEVDEQRLMALLTAYRGATPLVFPKRMEPGDDGARLAAASAYDPLFAGNPQLQWAHATFATDGDGKVRRWEEWLAACSNGRHFWLPAVATRVLAALADAGADVERSTKPQASADCRTRAVASERRLLVGPRITGRSASPFARNARTVSARMVLDPEIDRDDRWLFTGRVVLIGATHSGSSDLWLTPGGVVPGVELLANTIHYAPVDSSDGRASEIAYRGLAILLFLIFTAATWRLVGIAAFGGGLIGALLVVAIAIRGWDYFRVFESLESAIWLSVLYFGVQSLVELIADLARSWRSTAPGEKKGFWRSMWDACVKEEE
jgi:CHASE2 domain-containing sensor protein